MARSRSPSTDGTKILDGPRPTDPAEAKLWDVARRAVGEARERAAEEELAEAEAKAAEPSGPDASTVAGELPTAASPASLRARTMATRLADAGDGLSPLDQAETFASRPLVPQREFPTALTRMPIFRPSQRRTQQRIQDTDNAIAFDNGWARGRRLGPTLTIRDEDTLICLIRLRDRAYVGPTTALPKLVREITRTPGETTEVHRLQCTLQMVIDELGIQNGGTAFSTTLDSLRRLGACTVELVQQSADGRGQAGTQIQLIGVNWIAYDQHAIVDVVFPPVMAGWLRHTYSYLDWDVRRRLKGALTKAVHRFLSGQDASYAIGLDKLAAVVGYDGRRDHLRGKFGTACEELVRVGWLEDWSIAGNGRTKPLILSVRRAG